MQWKDINTAITIVIQNGKMRTKRYTRPWAAMPQWFKRWVKRLNVERRLQENLARRPKQRRNGARRKLAAGAILTIVLGSLLAAQQSSGWTLYNEDVPADGHIRLVKIQDGSCSVYLAYAQNRYPTGAEKPITIAMQLGQGCK